MHMDAQTVTLIFTIVTGVGVLLQAFVLLGMFFALKQTQKKVHALSESIEDHVLPLVASSRGLIDDLSPKLKIITANLVDASATLRSQSEQVKSVVDDISSRTRQQTARVDGMVTSALNSINQATAAVERTIAVPLRQVNSVLNGLRAGIEALKGKDPQPAVRTAPRTPPPAPPPVRPVATAPAPASSGITPEEASAAAARFVRDRAAASSGDLR
jgi:methyl-accepting chemotaxis protein